MNTNKKKYLISTVITINSPTDKESSRIQQFIKELE